MTRSEVAPNVIAIYVARLRSIASSSPWHRDAKKPRRHCATQSRPQHLYANAACIDGQAWRWLSSSAPVGI
jgi:hypothetical protein